MRGVVGVLVLVLSTGIARADEDSQALARAHFITGKSYFAQDRYADALKEFEEAYRLSKRPGFLYNIGVCHEHLGHINEAIDAFERYLVESPEASERAEVKQRIDRLRTLPPPRATMGRAVATVPPTAATATTAPPPPRPIHRRGWFWGVIGGVGALVIGGVVAGVVVGTRDTGPRTLPDVSVQ
jgi:tetratricopeptide (TPR) repeat protein